MHKRLPAWATNKYPHGPNVLDLKAKLRRQGLHTVCESARCPNQGECFSRGRVTFVIMGDRCTRTCRFCAVENETPSALDDTEPRRIAQACKAFGLQQVVITSVTRDDLPAGGAEHFARTISAIRKKVPSIELEVLTPDFKGQHDALATVAAAGPDVWGHNLETVAELYPAVRAGADYKQSLKVLDWIKQHADSIYTKSGLMLGLGETRPQVMRVLEDLRAVDCDFLTVGQYLQPTRNSLPVKEYISPAVFADYKQSAIELGFRYVISQPLARSSYQPVY